MDSLRAGDLAIEAVDQAGSALQLHWRGKSNDRHPGKVLEPYFTRVIAAAGARGATVELHFEKLDHFNSSTITALIQLLQDARSQGIKVVILFDKALKWQKLSFDALRVFAKGDDLLQIRAV